MTSPQEASALEDLVERYVSAYDAHTETPLGGQPREVWAGIPIRDEYNAVLTFVRKLHSTQGKFSDNNVESMVDDILGDALNAPQCVGKLVRDLIGLVDEPLTTRLYIPLEGVDLQPDEYRLGEIRLLKMHDAQFEELLIEPYRRSMLANKLYSDDFKQAQIESHRQNVESLKGRVCAEVSQPRDIELTLGYANETAIQAVCDFLQLAAAVFLADGYNGGISWATDVRGPVWRHAYAWSDNRRLAQRDQATRVSGSYALEIREEEIRKLEELRLDRLANLSGGQAATEYEVMLLRAIRWFAKGERELHPDDRKLAYVTVFDLFFSKPGKGATARICEGFAFASARRDDDVPGLARYMADIFASRSETSHAGIIGNLDEDGLKRLRWRALNFIIGMSRKEFHSKDDVTAWLGERKEAMTPDQRAALKGAMQRKIVPTTP